MHVAVFSAQPHDRATLPAAAGGRHAFDFIAAPCTAGQAAAQHAEVACVFANDRLDRATLEALARAGVRLVALRCAGSDNVDRAAAAELGLAVARVPAYSPHAVAEQAFALILALDRKVPNAWNRVRAGNYALDGLLGDGLHGRALAVVGTGRIGAAAARIGLGFGMRVLAHDPQPDPALAAAGVRYLALETALADADIVTLHCPLVAATRHLIDRERIDRLRRGAMLVNTGRGALIDTPAVIEALLDGRIGALGIDVYEGEADLFFVDRSQEPLRDAVFARLLTLANVLVTPHQGFFTREAIAAIAATTVANIDRFAAGETMPGEIVPPPVRG